MPYHTHEIPDHQNGSGHEAKYYVATRISATDWSVSDTDPQDDVRYWNSLSMARSAAQGYLKQGWPADHIVEVNPLERCIHRLGVDEESPEHPEAGTW